MQLLVLWSIKFYQRFISPHKGFCCAYRTHTGRASCSSLGYRVVRRYGVINGLAVLRKRLYLCGVAHRRYSPPYRRPMPAQRGDCDIGCIGDCGSTLDYASCLDCGSCDWPNRKNAASEKEQYVYIPPRVSRKVDFSSG